MQHYSPSNHKHCFAGHWIIQLPMHSNRSNTWTLNTAHSRYLAVTLLRGHKRRPISRPLGRGMGVPREFRDHIAVVLRSDPDTSLQWRHSKRNGVIFGFCYVWSFVCLVLYLLMKVIIFSYSMYAMTMVDCLAFILLQGCPCPRIFFWDSLATTNLFHIILWIISREVSDLATISLAVFYVMGKSLACCMVIKC